MPVSHEQARLIAERLSSNAELTELAARLEPVPESVRPIPPEVPAARDWSAAAVAERVAFASARCGVELDQVSGKAERVPPETLKGNIEQYVGMAQIPIGLIGPLRINGAHANGDYYVPLATTEGVLVASYQRGARIATKAGGIAAVTITEKVQRAPMFAFPTIAKAGLFAAWVSTEFPALEGVANSRSSHTRLLGCQVHLEANHVYLLFEFHTGDASGQNMATLATQLICEDLVARSPVKPSSWFLEANMSGDKKATALAFQNTRGRKVVAEVVIPADLVEAALHTTVDRMCDYWRASVVGAMSSGAIGANGHYANGLAALFIACGQDVACVSEASVGLTRMEKSDGGDLYVGVTLPGLVVGTVGGGTRMPTAQECLRLIDCEGEGRAQRFAEICAATILAGEISIVGALCAGEFARAHEKLGRPGAPSAR